VFVRHIPIAADGALFYPTLTPEYKAKFFRFAVGKGKRRLGREDVMMNGLG
jgi:hypothetical protein